MVLEFVHQPRPEESCPDHMTQGKAHLTLACMMRTLRVVHARGVVGDGEEVGDPTVLSKSTFNSFSLLLSAHVTSM